MLRSILRAKPKGDEMMPRSRMSGSAVVLVILMSITLVPRPTSASDSAEAVPPSDPIHRSHPVRLLSSTPAGIRFELDVPWQELRVEPATVGGKAYVRVSLPGWSFSAEPGAPELPFLTETVGVPYGARVSVRVEPGPVHTLALAAPVAPVATQEFAYGQVAAIEGLLPLPASSLTVAENPAVYGGATTYPGILARIANEGLVRQQHVAGIAIYPVQYHPGARKLTIYETLRVELTFEGSTPEGAFYHPKEASAESAVFEALSRETLLNYETARAWRQPPSTPLSPTPGGSGGTSASPPLGAARARLADQGQGDRLLQADLRRFASRRPAGRHAGPRTFQLYNLGSEVAIDVAGEATGASTCRFPGLLWTGHREQVHAGQRLLADLRDGDRPAHGGARRYAGDRGDAGLLHRAAAHEQNKFYIPMAPGEEDLERWLWDYIYSPSRPSWSHALSLAAPDAGSGTAILKVAMLGYLQNPINPDHHTRLNLNGTLVEDATWDGITWHVRDRGPAEPAEGGPQHRLGRLPQRHRRRVRRHLH